MPLECDPQPFPRSTDTASRSWRATGDSDEFYRVWEAVREYDFLSFAGSVVGPSSAATLLERSDFATTWSGTLTTGPWSTGAREPTVDIEHDAACLQAFVLRGLLGARAVTSSVDTELLHRGSGLSTDAPFQERLAVALLGIASDPSRSDPATRNSAEHRAELSFDARYPHLAARMRGGHVSGRNRPDPMRRTLRVVEEPEDLAEGEQIAFGKAGEPRDQFRRRPPR